MKFEIVDANEAPVEAPKTLMMSADNSFLAYQGGTCAVYAYHKAFEVDFKEALQTLTNWGFTPKGGTPIAKFRSLLKTRGWGFTYHKVRLNATAPDRLPNECILLFKRHVAYYKDGVIYDQFHTRNAKDCRQTIGYYMPTDNVDEIRWR